MRTHSISLVLLVFLISSILPPPVLPLAPPYACHSSMILRSNKNLIFCNRTLSITERVDDILTQLTLKEKISQLGDIAPSVDRLGIPAYKWWSESLHGISYYGKGILFQGRLPSATSFPQVIHTAATFNPKLWYRVGAAIAEEARAFYNAGQAQGLTFWTPNINIFRDPRWGRGQETPGEDPLVTSKYGVTYVRGLQGDSYEGDGGSSEMLKVSACCKHFTAYDLENWKGINRFTFDASVSKQDLEDTYQPPFKSCVLEGRASAMMCSYNKVNGVPACADYNLMTKTARNSWGFKGYIASDCGAVSDIFVTHKYVKTPEDAVVVALKAGMDVECGTYVQEYAASAIKQGKLSESDIDRALQKLLTVRMRLGLFNGNPLRLPFGTIPPTRVCNQKHKNLALKAARDGIVLLKNSANLLPLSLSKVKSLAVIGPNSNSAWKLSGSYSGIPCNSITPLQVLQDYVKDTHYISGCDDGNSCNSSSIAEAVVLASSVDYVVMFMGLDQSIEREELDRVDLAMPGKQQSLVTSVAKAAKNPVILVLICGGSMDVSFAKYDRTIGGILWAGYPAETGGQAIAEVIFGKHNPGGRLPVTWYPQEFTKVPMTDMRMRADRSTGYPGRTYRFYTGKPVFEFGYGLSYSTYSYKFASTPRGPIFLNKSISLQSSNNHTSYDFTETERKDCEKLKFSTTVRVKNHGPMAGRHSVLLFLRRPNVLGGRPRKQLISFESVHIVSGEEAGVDFVLSPCEHFSLIAADGKKLVDEGSHFLMVGDEEHEFSILGHSGGIQMSGLDSSNNLLDHSY